MATTQHFEPATYTQLTHGDHVKIPQMYNGTLTGWWWPILTVDRIDWIRDDHTALMLRLTHPLPCGDKFVLITGRAMVDAGVRRATRADSLTPDERRLLNSWNAARHGWDRFQTGSRRATLRMARKPFDYIDDENTVEGVEVVQRPVTVMVWQPVGQDTPA